jgi:hypothetical protein
MGATTNTKEIAMIRFAALALVLTATFIGTGSASAQDRQVTANVPFTFMVGDKTMPAGTYTITARPNSPDVVALSNWYLRVNVRVMGRPDQNNPEQANVLVFHKYGNQYFLSRIRSDGEMNIDFAASKTEKRTRVQVEEAGRAVDDPVLIALK